MKITSVSSSCENVRKGCASERPFARCKLDQKRQVARLEIDCQTALDFFLDRNLFSRCLKLQRQYPEMLHSSSNLFDVPFSDLSGMAVRGTQ